MLHNVVLFNTEMQDHFARYDFFDAQRTLGLCLAGKLSHSYT
jgi:hypothetical protein